MRRLRPCRRHCHGSGSRSSYTARRCSCHRAGFAFARRHCNRGLVPTVGPALARGGVLIAGYSIFREAQLRSQLTTATRLDANIYCSEFVRSPFLLGTMRPRIYIPYGLDPQTQQFVLAHEQYHLRRLDHITRRISFLFLAIHWFNPLCWLAFALCGKDMELSCDEAVLRQEGVYSADCSTALLSFAVNRRMFSPAPWPLARPASRPASKTFCAGNAPSRE